jgi:hypothetical protein
MGIKGFAITLLGISTFSFTISLRMLEASTTSPGFPSWARNIFVISLFVVIASLFFFLFLFTSRIALTSTIIFSFLFWVFFLVSIDFYFSSSHCFKE